MCCDITTYRTCAVTEKSEFTTIKYCIAVTEDIIRVTFDSAILEIKVCCGISCIKCILASQKCTVCKFRFISFNSKCCSSLCCSLWCCIKSVSSLRKLCICRIYTVFYFFICYITVEWSLKCNSVGSECSSTVLYIYRAAPFWSLCFFIFVISIFFIVKTCWINAVIFVSDTVIPCKKDIFTWILLIVYKWDIRCCNNNLFSVCTRFDMNCYSFVFFWRIHRSRCCNSFLHRIIIKFCLILVAYINVRYSCKCVCFLCWYK